MTAPAMVSLLVHDCTRCNGQGEVLTAGDYRADNFELAACGCCNGQGGHAHRRRCPEPPMPRRKPDGAW